MMYFKNYFTPMAFVEEIYLKYHFEGNLTQMILKWVLIEKKNYICPRNLF